LIVGTKAADFTIDSSFVGQAPDGMGGHILGNDITGFEVQDSNFHGLRITNTVVAGNGNGGVFFHVSAADHNTFRDFLIKDSYIGAAPDGAGGTFDGNRFSGFQAQNSQFFGVAFLDSSFNGNGTAVGFGAGIFFFESTIQSGTVTIDANTTLTTGFTLKDSQAIGNSVDGVEFDGVTATDVTFDKVAIAHNTRDGIFVRDRDTTDSFISSFTNFLIQDSSLGAVDIDGDPATTDDSFIGNGRDGLHILDTTIAPDANVAGSFGLRIDPTTIVGNALDGILIDTANLTDVTIADSTIAENGSNGVHIKNSTITDLLIQDSSVGQDANFDGNSVHGFFGETSTFNGVAILDSFFNGNGTGQSGGNGIFFLESTINPETTNLKTGFTLKNTQVVGNTSIGVEFDGVAATDVTFDNVTIAQNSGDGVFITESEVSDFAIQNSHLGSTAIFAGNGGDGFDAEDSILTGAAFIGSSFNGNGQNGVNIANSSVDDVSIDGGTTINDNDDGGIRITASALAGTNGSILFGNATITDNVTGIMVESADATAPLLLTFGSTTISGGTDGLVLSGAGIALTGGGGALPSGITSGGGMAPGDRKFGGSLGTLAFSGQSGDFIRLENGALFEPGEPTVIDASQVTFDGVAGGKLTNTVRQGVMDKIVDFKDDMSLGLISLLPTPAPVTTPTMLPPPAQNPGIIPGLPGKQNTPGDTLFSLTGGLEFNPAPGVANSFCFAYSLADPTATGSEENETCVDLGPSPAHVTPNQDLRNFWRGWQAARL
jgi:hypothetical protein